MLSNMTTIRTLDRSLARGLGTIVGAIVLSGILAFNINPVVAILIMSISALMTEAFVASNYAFAVIFITIQVIMLNGLASQNLSYRNCLHTYYRCTCRYYYCSSGHSFPSS